MVPPYLYQYSKGVDDGWRTKVCYEEDDELEEKKGK